MITGLINQSSIRYLLLNPSIHFTSIIKEARSVVVAGGTMEPVNISHTLISLCQFLLSDFRV